MHSPCHIIQLALQKHFCHGINYSLWHAPSSQSVYFGEITRVMRHICIFSRDIFSPPISPLILGGCYCRLSARMFIWLVVESISICYILYVTWYDSTKYRLSLKAVFSIILFSHKFYFLRSFSQAFLDIYAYSLETSHNTS